MDLYDLLEVSQEPILEIHSWIQEAKESSVGLPHAMNLASVNASGPVSYTHLTLPTILLV